MPKSKKPRKTENPIRVPLKPRNYQPNKDDLDEECDMPEMTEKELRETFMRPFEFISEEEK